MLSEEEIDRKALETWGLDLQIIITVEELSELQKALCKFLRHKEKECTTILESISEEIADVEVMINQIKMAFQNHDFVAQKKVEKLQKVSERLSKTKEVMEDVVSLPQERSITV
jgi:methyl-accepting chemotaxis protein